MKATSKQQSCWNFSWLILIHVFSIFLALLLSNIGAVVRCFLISRRKTKPHPCLSLLSIVAPLGDPINWLLGLGELLHAFYFNGSTLSQYNNVIKNIFDDEDHCLSLWRCFLFNDIGYLHSTLSIPRNVRLQKAWENKLLCLLN